MTMGNGERINDRQTLREQAKSLGIDTRGMTRDEKEAAIEVETNRREEQHEMAKFIQRQLDADIAKRQPPPPQPLPTVTAAPVSESTSRTGGHSEPVSTAVNGGGGGGAGGDTIEIVVVDNGEFKTGNFYIDGELNAV